jgi:ribose 5-phosphate isomerase B
MSHLTIAIGCDHAGFEYKEQLKNFLTEKGYTVIDFGTNSAESVDYPDYVHPLAAEVASGQIEMGILLCGSGNGVCMTANKHRDIRAALCWNIELAKLARQHNNANIICLPARFISIDDAKEMTLAFLNTPFEGGRHERRVEKISNC